MSIFIKHYFASLLSPVILLILCGKWAAEIAFADDTLENLIHVKWRGKKKPNNQEGRNLVETCLHQSIFKIFWLSRFQLSGDWETEVKTKFWLSDILTSEVVDRREEKEEGERGKKENSCVRKLAGWWEKHSAIRIQRRNCKSVSKFLLWNPVYVRQAHPFFISYCRHLFVRNDLVLLKDVLRQGSHIVTIVRLGCARIWNSAADVDLTCLLGDWKKGKKPGLQHLQPMWSMAQN